MVSADNLIERLKESLKPQMDRGLPSTSIRLWDASPAGPEATDAPLENPTGKRIGEWRLACPYTISGASATELLDFEFEPERASAKTSWNRVSAPNGVIDLGKLFPGDFQVAYAHARIWSPLKRSALLLTGSNDELKVWLNGVVVHQAGNSRPYLDGEDTVPVSLRQGWNDLLLKVVNYRDDWKVGAQFATTQAQPLEDILISAEADADLPVPKTPGR